MSDVPVEKKFAVLCEIARAQHFAWRSAARELCPDVPAEALVNRMWEKTGRETAQAYLKRLDPKKPIAAQVARSIAWSSDCMGESATAEEGATANEAFVRHTDCPWFRWHKRLDLVSEDRPGCDAWFRSTVNEVNRAMGTSLRTETIESLPDGGATCLRRLWVDDVGR